MWKTQSVGQGNEADEFAAGAHSLVYYIEIFINEAPAFHRRKKLERPYMRNCFKLLLQHSLAFDPYSISY